MKQPQWFKISTVIAEEEEISEDNESRTFAHGRVFFLGFFLNSRSSVSAIKTRCFDCPLFSPHTHIHTQAHN